MSLLRIWANNPRSPVFTTGQHDAALLKRIEELDDLYSGKSTEAIVACDNDGQSIPIRTYVWKTAQPQTSGPRKLTIILNGIFTNARSNDHTGLYFQSAGTSDVLTFDYPGKNSITPVLPTKEHYTPQMYVNVLTGLLREYHDKYDEIFLMGYSHGARVIYDLFNSNYNDPKIKGVILADMGPERPEDAAKRRTMRNQHNQLHPNLTQATSNLAKFFSGHGQTLPEDFVLNVIHRNLALKDDGEVTGLEFRYDPRSMMGYCDEIKANPRMGCWSGFNKITVPILFVLGSDTNTVPADLIEDMKLLKTGRVTLDRIESKRGLRSSFLAAAMHQPVTPFYILSCMGTGHYPEPHRLSQFKVLGDFIASPTAFDMRASLAATRTLFQPVDTSYDVQANRYEGVLPTPLPHTPADLLPHFKPDRILK